MRRGEESGEDKSETPGEKEVNEVLRDGIRFESTIVGGSKSDGVVPLSSRSLWACDWGIALSPSE